jgi:hypothetical protein
MKRALTTAMAITLALPLLGGEKSTKADEKPAQQKTAKAATTEQAPPPAATGPESPLVAAARRANRLGRKSTTTVITNESVKSSRGHVTIGSVDRPMNVPEPVLGPEAKLAAENAARAAAEKKSREQTAAQQKQVAEEKARAAAAAAARAEEGYDGMQDDAGEFVGQTQSPPPQR